MVSKGVYAGVPEARMSLLAGTAVPVHLAPQTLPQAPRDTRVASRWHVPAPQASAAPDGQAASHAAPVGGGNPLLLLAVPNSRPRLLVPCMVYTSRFKLAGRPPAIAWPPDTRPCLRVASTRESHVNRMQSRRRGRGCTLSIAARSSGSHEDRLLGSASAAPGAWRDVHAMPFAVEHM